MLEWIVWNRTLYFNKMDLALNNLQCHKTQTTNQQPTTCSWNAQPDVNLVNSKERSITLYTWTRSNCLPKRKKNWIEAVINYGQDIGMEFGIEKCSILIMKSGKQYMTERMELLKQEKIRRKCINTCEYWKVTSSKQVKMKEKIEKENLRRSRKIFENKLYIRKLIKRKTTWAVPFVRYSGPFLKWNREELEQMDQWIRKLMTNHKVLHFSDEVDRLCVNKRRRRRRTYQHWK